MNKLLVLLVFVSSNLIGQVTDTVKISYDKSCVLYFKSKTIYYHASSEAFSVLHFNNKLILQALEEGFPETSLYVEDGGEAYVFIVQYREDLTKFLYRYPIINSDTLTNSGGSLLVTDEYFELKNDSIKAKAQDSIYKVNCENVLARKDRIGNRGVVKYKMGYYLRDIVFIDDKAYLKIQCLNRSNINFRRDNEFFSVINTKRRIKGVPEQVVKLNVVYSLGTPDNIKGKQDLYYVIVVDKFVLTADKKLECQLWEVNGSDLDEEGGRKLHFDVFYNDVLNSTN